MNELMNERTNETTNERNERYLLHNHNE